jgi:hypothetical protein
MLAEQDKIATPRQAAAAKHETATARPAHPRARVGTGTVPAENRQPAQSPGQTISRTHPDPVLDLSPPPRHPERHGHRLRLQSSVEGTEDHHTVAVPWQDRDRRG